MRHPCTIRQHKFSLLAYWAISTTAYRPCIGLCGCIQQWRYMTLHYPNIHCLWGFCCIRPLRQYAAKIKILLYVMVSTATRGLHTAAKAVCKACMQQWIYPICSSCIRIRTPNTRIPVGMELPNILLHIRIIWTIQMHDGNNKDVH